MGSSYIENEKKDPKLSKEVTLRPRQPLQLKFKENYLDLLIQAANGLIRSGLNIDDLKELKKSPSSSMKIHKASSPQNGNFFSFKCENKVCPVIVTKKTNIFQAKIGSLKNKILWLCSQCHQAWKNGQYCYYCGVIYRQYRGTKGFNDHKTWIGCEFCKNWEHVQCEEQKGNYSNLSQLIKKDKHFKYKCPICRTKGFGKDEFLQIKRKNETDIENKRKIKKKKEFDEGNGTMSTHSHEKNDIIDDVEKILSLG